MNILGMQTVHNCGVFIFSEACNCCIIMLVGKPRTSVMSKDGLLYQTIDIIASDLYL